MRSLSHCIKLNNFFILFSSPGIMVLLSSCSVLSRSEEPVGDIPFGATEVIADYSDCIELPTKEERIKCLCAETPEYCEKFRKSEELPFAIIENFPVYPECEKVATKEERIECINKFNEREVEKKKKSGPKEESRKTKENPAINKRSKSPNPSAIAISH